MATHLLDLVRVNTATTGTGTMTLGTAVAGHLTPALAGAVDGDTLRYVIIDGANTELGTGTYSASANTLTRGMYLSTTNAVLNLSGSAQVLLTLAAEDLASTQLSDFQVGELQDGMAAVWSTALGKWVPGAIGAKYLGTRPQIVQQISTSGYPSTSWTLTFPAPPTAGNTLLIVYTPLNDAINMPSGFTTVGSISAYAGSVGAVVVSKVSVGSADQTLTATIGSGAGNGMTIAAFEVSGVGSINVMSGTYSVASQAVATHSGGQYSETSTWAISSTAAPTQNIGNSLFLSIGCTIGPVLTTPFNWSTLLNSYPAGGRPLWVLSSPTWVQPQGAMSLLASYWTLLNLQIVGVPLKLATDLADVAISSPTNGQSLVWNSSAGAWENTTLSASTGSTYSGADTLVGTASDVAVNGYTGGGAVRTEVVLAKVALTGNYPDLANIPARTLANLTDVNVAEGSGIDGYYLKWSNSTGKWIAATVGSAYALSGASDVALSSPTNGQVLTYNSSTSKWVNATPSAAPVPSTSQFQSTSTAAEKNGANAGSIAITQGASGVVVTMPGTSSMMLDRVDLSSYPATPVTFIVGVQFPTTNYSESLALYIRDASGKSVWWNISNLTLLMMHISYTSSSTSWVSTPYSRGTAWPPKYLGIKDDGTNFVFLMGDAPDAMSIVYTESRSAYIGTPVAVGVLMQGSGQSGSTTAYVINYLSP